MQRRRLHFFGMQERTAACLRGRPQPARARARTRATRHVALVCVVRPHAGGPSLPHNRGGAQWQSPSHSGAGEGRDGECAAGGGARWCAEESGPLRCDVGWKRLYSFSLITRTHTHTAESGQRHTQTTRNPPTHKHAPFLSLSSHNPLTKPRPPWTPHRPGRPP